MCEYGWLRKSIQIVNRELCTIYLKMYVRNFHVTHQQLKIKVPDAHGNNSKSSALFNAGLRKHTREK